MIPASTLKLLSKRLSAVQADTFVFCGERAYAVGQNITISVISPDLGTFGVSADKFNTLAGRWDGDVTVELGTKLKLKNKRSKVELPVIAEPHVPTIKVPETTPSILPTRDLLGMLQYAAQASERSDQFSFSGVVALSSCGQLTAAATNGQRVAVITGPASPTLPQLLIPAKYHSDFKGAGWR